MCQYTNLTLEQFSQVGKWLGAERHIHTRIYKATFVRGNPPGDVFWKTFHDFALNPPRIRPEVVWITVKVGP